MRFEREINIYGDETVLKRFQAAETSISAVQGKISALISESELTELENSNATMYSKLASAIMEIDALTINFSDLTTKYNTVSGQYSALNSKVATYKASVDELSADISSVQQNLSKNYSTTTQVNSAINAKANEISAKVSSVETTLKNNYSTTNEMNSAINAKANAISASVSSTYATKGALNSATNRISSLETWKNEASLKITDNAIIATVTSSMAFRQKADKESLISQINMSSERVEIKSSKINLEGIITANSNFKILEDGSMVAKNGTFSGEVNSTSVLTGELQVKSGHIVGYYNGYKGIEINGTRMQVYAWSDLGNYIGSIGSVKETDTGRLEMAMWVNRGDTLMIGYDAEGDEGTGEFNATIYPLIKFYASESNINNRVPPWILGGVTGTLTLLYGVSGSTQYKVNVTVKNGIITGWSY